MELITGEDGTKLITGWLMIDGVTVLAKCKILLNTLSRPGVLLQVVTPRKHRGRITLKHLLSKNKESCLRRHIKILKAALVQEQESFEYHQRQSNQINQQIIKAKEELANGKS